MRLIVCMTQEIFKMLNPYAVDTFPVNLRFFHFFRDPGGMLSRSVGMPSRSDRPSDIWDTHGISGNIFADPVASSTALYTQELNPWSSGRVETIRSSTAEKNENQTPIQD